MKIWRNSSYLRWHLTYVETTSCVYWDHWFSMLLLIVIPILLYNSLKPDPYPSLNKITGICKANFVWIVDINVSFVANCHTRWWNDSFTFCVCQFSTAANKLGLPNFSKSGLMISATACGKGLFIGLGVLSPVASSLLKLHQLSLPFAQY